MTGFAPESGPKQGRQKVAKPKPRWKIYAQQLLKGKSKREAALIAGYSESVAHNPQDKIEKQHPEYFRKLFDKFAPDELLMLRIRQGLDATVVKTASQYGEITDIQEFVDFQTRGEYIDRALKIKGIAHDKSAAIYAPTQININIRTVGE